MPWIKCLNDLIKILCAFFPTYERLLWKLKKQSFVMLFFAAVENLYPLGLKDHYPRETEQNCMILFAAVMAWNRQNRSSRSVKMVVAVVLTFPLKGRREDQPFPSSYQLCRVCRCEEFQLLKLEVAIPYYVT